MASACEAEGHGLGRMDARVAAVCATRAPAMAAGSRRPFTAKTLADRLTLRGRKTSTREAHMLLVGLEHRGMVELSPVPGMWRLTPAGLEAARAWAAVGEEQGS